MSERSINKENEYQDNSDGVDNTNTTGTNTDSTVLKDANDSKENNNGNNTTVVIHKQSTWDRVFNIASTATLLACTIAIGVFSMKSNKQ